MSNRSESLKGNRNAIGPHTVTQYRHMNRQIAETIRRLYFARHYKQSELAELFGIAQASVSRIVSGQVWA